MPQRQAQHRVRHGSLHDERVEESARVGGGPRRAHLVLDPYRRVRHAIHRLPFRGNLAEEK